MKLSFLLPVCLVWTACQSPPKTPDPKAEMLRDSASRVSVRAMKESDPPDAGELGKASKLLDQAITLDPGYKAAYSDQLTLLGHMREPDKLLALARTMMDKWPDNIAAYNAAGTIYDLRNDTVSAFYYYDRYIRLLLDILDTTDRKSAAYDGFALELAGLYMTRGQKPKAEALLNTLREKNGNDLNGFYDTILVYSRPKILELRRKRMSGKP